MVSALMLFIAASGLAPADMADLIEQRLAALDRLVLDVTLEVCGGHSDSPVLDRAAWNVLATYPYRVSILRPNVRVEFLKDDPQAGYQPVVASVFDGEYTQRSARPSARGTWVYGVVPQARQAGVVLWNPLLQVLDLGLYDSPPPGDLNIVSVLRDPSATLVRSVGAISTYAALVPTSHFPMRFEMDIDDAGLPLRIKSSIEYREANTPPTYYEEFVLQTTPVNGAELPTEIAVTHWGAKMPNYWNVWLYRVSSVEVCNDLTAADVQVEVERRNAAVTEYLPDGTARVTQYNERGEPTDTTSFSHPVNADTGDPAAIARAARWNKAVGPAAGGIGLVTALALAHLARRGHH
jgi:hypothetical protein